MVCGSCVARITRAVTRLDGVSAVRVDLRREAVTVRREPGRPPDPELAAAVATAGYEADLAGLEHVPLDETLSFFARILRRTR
jgi:copper chaperone CopZ